MKKLRRISPLRLFLLFLCAIFLLVGCALFPLSSSEGIPSKDYIAVIERGDEVVACLRFRETPCGYSLFDCSSHFDYACITDITLIDKELLMQAPPSEEEIKESLEDSSETVEAPKSGLPPSDQEG